MRPFFGYMVCAALAATVVSCRHEMPLQYMAGVVEAVTPASLTVRSIAGDSVLMFVVDEATERSGGDAIEGNAVEVCYRGSHDSPELTALSVTGNETYTDVLGRWATGRRAELPVEIELLPRGEVRQTAPPSLLHFDGWYVDGVQDGRISLTGEVTIVTDTVERYPFTARAELREDERGKMLVVEGASGSVIRMRRAEN